MNHVNHVNCKNKECNGIFCGEEYNYMVQCYRCGLEQEIVSEKSRKEWEKTAKEKADKEYNENTRRLAKIGEEIRLDIKLDKLLNEKNRTYCLLL